MTTEIAESRSDEPRTSLHSEEGDTTDPAVEAQLRARLAGLAEALAHEINNSLAVASLSLRRAGQRSEPLSSALRRLRDVAFEIGMLSTGTSNVSERLCLAEVMEHVITLTDTDTVRNVQAELWPVDVEAERGRLYRLIHLLLVLHLPSAGSLGTLRLGCGSQEDDAIVEIETDGGQDRSTMRADFAAALQGTEPLLALPGPIIERAAREVGAKYSSSETEDGLRRTRVLFPRASSSAARK